MTTSRPSSCCTKARPSAPPSARKCARRWPRLRAAGKEIYAHADSLHMRDYVLLSGATRLSVVPTADLWVTGLFGEPPYLRGLLDKLGVQPEFLTCGAYKSAAEIFMREGPSPEAETMQNWLLDGILRHLRQADRQRPQGRRRQGQGVDRRRPVHGREGQGRRPDRRRRAPPGLRDVRQSPSTATTSSSTGSTARRSSRSSTSQPVRHLQALGEMMAEAKKKKSGQAGRRHRLRRRADQLGQKRALAVRRGSDGRVQHRHPQGARRGGPRRLDQGGRAAGRFARRLGRRQRDHPRRHQAGEGEEAVRRLDGRRGRQRRLLRRLRLRHIFADEATITGSIGVVGGKFVTNPMWNKVGITLQELQARRERRPAGVRPPAARRTSATRMQAWMDEIYGVFKGHVTGDPRRPAQEADRRAGRRPGLHRQAGAGARPGRQDRHAAGRDRPRRRAGQADRLRRPRRAGAEEHPRAVDGGGRRRQGRQAQPRRREQSRVRADRWPVHRCLDLAAPQLEGLDPVRVAGRKASAAAVADAATAKASA